MKASLGGPGRADLEQHAKTVNCLKTSTALSFRAMLGSLMILLYGEMLSHQLPIDHEPPRPAELS